MDNRPLTPDASTHQNVQELLPWFVTNALNAGEAALVREHLRICAQCQADVEWQHKFRTACPEPREAPDVDQAFLRMRQQIDMLPRADARPALSRRLRSGLGSGSPWMRWALAGQAGIIATLVVLLASPSGLLPLYHGLGAPGTAAGNIVVIFRPETSEQQLRQILRESGARIVDGPSAADAYVLSVKSTEQERAIGTLRGKGAVVLVEPLGSGGNH
jgi:hypothetical protein